MNKLAKSIFVIYILLIINFVIIKNFGDFADIHNRLGPILWNRSMGIWNYNLMPFRTINAASRSTLELNLHNPFFRDIVLNLVIYLPLGFLIPIVFQRKPFIKTLLISILFITLVEIIQFITCLGILDVDDIMLGTLGAMIGYGIYFLSNKFIYEKSSRST